MGLEEATKLMPLVVKSIKEYVCLMEIHKELPVEKVMEVINQFKGKIYQRPPVRSSVKRRLRVKTVYDIQLLENSGRLYLLKISSESGTYMRKICHDIGIILGCGAHMRELRRIRTGIFDETKNLVTLHELSEALYLWKNCKDESELRRILLPMEYACCGIPKVIVDDFTVNSLAHGAPLYVPGVVAFQEFKANDTIAILTLKGEIVALGKALVDSNSIPNMSKGMIAKVEKVIMPRDVYPKGRNE
ncbi:MAG: RNA-guided pseudouridylation complex pseudouridine synthase subunit Cbf5 [Sulfolobaceae archaeon]